MQPRRPAAYSLSMTRFQNRSKTCGAVLIGCALILSAALVGSSCSSSADSASQESSTAPPSTTASPKVPDQADCVPPVTTSPVQVTAVSPNGSAIDIDLVSFDGTVIRGHWFALPSATTQDPAPTILMGPGWSLSGDTAVDSVGILGVVGISTLRSAGYNVLTWDPRGFGESTGVAQVNSKEFEARDVSELLNWVATQGVAQLDGQRNPRVGMVGGSYGGGIQLVTAATDCRVDAIVPVIAWNSLQSSLYKADTVKSGWAKILSDSSASDSVDPHVRHAQDSAAATGRLDAEDQAWFIARGPAELVNQITAPTLIVQGTVDTLFTLGEGITNYNMLTKNGVPVSMIWYCDGHGVCLTNPGDPLRVTRAVIAWMDRYVANDTSVDTGPGFDVIDQDGVRYTATSYAEGTGTPLTASGSGTLELTAEGGSGPAVIPEGAGSVLSGLVESITPALASNAVNLPLVVKGGPDLVLGAPELSLSYSGTNGTGDRPTRVFAQLVDASTSLVIGNQITPVEVVLDGAKHQVRVPLEVIAFAAKPGATITLQIVASTVAYAAPQFGGRIDFDSIDLSLPVVAPDQMKRQPA